ncbi:hypothetical protein GGR56DRAFT_659375 [Xylariaceae sp. FL0804]|nr:hypothetical protein GGR56DRAFT_659375 [Xylariaceae sp. FL0804]
MASGRLFLRLCATDFPGVGSGSLDFKKANTTSMEDCMTACAAEAECRAVTWVWGPQGYFSNYCWMKNGTTGGGVPTDSGIQESAVIC